MKIWETGKRASWHRLLTDILHLFRQLWQDMLPFAGHVSSKIGRETCIPTIIIQHHSIFPSQLSSGWWFGRFSSFHILGYIGNNHPNGLIFFRGVGISPTSHSLPAKIFAKWGWQMRSRCRKAAWTHVGTIWEPMAATRGNVHPERRSWREIPAADPRRWMFLFRS